MSKHRKPRSAFAPENMSEVCEIRKQFRLSCRGCDYSYCCEGIGKYIPIVNKNYRDKGEESRGVSDMHK